MNACLQQFNEAPKGDLYFMHDRDVRFGEGDSNRWVRGKETVISDRFAARGLGDALLIPLKLPVLPGAESTTRCQICAIW